MTLHAEIDVLYLPGVHSLVPRYVLCFKISFHLNGTYLYDKGLRFHSKFHYLKLKTNTTFLIDLIFFSIYVFLMTHSNHNKMRMAAQMENTVTSNPDHYSP